MDWKQILNSVDDDYLMGISNKGIVKRAYKDKDELGEIPKIIIDNSSDYIDIAIGGENVSISYPFSDSKCSCPSRSVCRHIVLGILLAKDYGSVVAEVETNGMRRGNKESEENIESEENKESEGNKESEENIESKKNRENKEEAGICLKQVKEEIKEFSLRKLVRAMGNKNLCSLIETAEKGEFPKIEESTITTVYLPNQGNIVKLLSPLEYATCTCHKKELCGHKAEAILWYSLKEKWISIDDLKAELEQESDFDKEQVKKIATQIGDYLEEIVCMGLSRTSNEVVHALERLAVIAHTGKLPKVENKLRALADDYKDYLKRSTRFSMKKTLYRIVNLYDEMLQLTCAKTNIEIEMLAGEFHAEYKSVGDLELIGVTWEHFVSQSGYEGDTIYFLEVNTTRWYTYTNARPVFYEQKKRGGYSEKAQAPWGISASFEDMVNLHIRLLGAKCDEAGRLSSTKEAKGEILGNRELTKECLKNWYYTDFGKVFEDQIGIEVDKGSQTRQEKFVFIQPASIENAKFDEIEQILRMVLYDEQGRRLYIEVPFSKKEENTIRYLEHLKVDEDICFLGRLYLKDSELYMYPLDLYRKKEIPWLKENMLGNKSKNKPKVKNSIFVKTKLGTNTEIYDNTEPHADTIVQNTLQGLLEEVELFLENFYQVGFQTVQDSLIDHLKELQEKTQIYGLEQLSKRLEVLMEMANTKRHHIASQNDKEIIKCYRALCQYIWIGLKKTAYDKAKVNYL